MVENAKKSEPVHKRQTLKSAAESDMSSIKLQHSLKFVPFFPSFLVSIVAWSWLFWQLQKRGHLSSTHTPSCNDCIVMENLTDLFFLYDPGTITSSHLSTLCSPFFLPRREGKKGRNLIFSFCPLEYEKSAALVRRREKKYGFSGHSAIVTTPKSVLARGTC